MNYVFEVKDNENVVVTAEEFTSDQVCDVPVHIWKLWTHKQEINFGKHNNKRNHNSWKSTFAVIVGAETVVLEEVEMYSPKTWLTLKDYDLIERITDSEFLSSDVAYTILTGKHFEVSVIDGEGDDAWVFIDNKRLCYFYSIHCSSKSRLLEVLSLGQGRCAPQFFPSLDGYTLSENYTPEENEAWLAYLTQIH